MLQMGVVQKPGPSLKIYRQLAVTREAMGHTHIHRERHTERVNHC